MTNEKAIMCLEDMKIKVPIPKAAKQARENNEALDVAIKALQNIPHWIPVTEPPKGDFMPYYATCRSKVDDRENWVIEGMYTKYSGWEYPPMVRDDRAEIIAWMPKELPEPFKGVTE